MSKTLEWAKEYCELFEFAKGKDSKPRPFSHEYQLYKLALAIVADKEGEDK